MSAKPKKYEALENVAHAQVNELFDVHSLLEGALTTIGDGGQIDPAEAAVLQRLVRMSREKVQGVIDAFNPYV